jgi:DNA-directed RNA polymerase subunit K/omega
MKFVEIDEILASAPNKYATIILAAKEARKIIEARKPPPLPKESDELAVEARLVVPESQKTIIEKEVKKRGRKPKKLTVDDHDNLESMTIKEESDLSETISITENRVTAEKDEENPYMAALKKAVKTMKEKYGKINES